MATSAIPVDNNGTLNGSQATFSEGSNNYTPSITTVEKDGAPNFDYCNVKWAEAMAVCRENLSDSDRTFLSNIETLDDCKRNIMQLYSHSAQNTGSSIFQQVSSILDPLFHLVTLLTTSFTKATIQTTLVWGLITLVVRAATQTRMLLDGTIEMIQELGHDLKIFELQRETFARNPQIGEELVDILVEIITFWAMQVRFLNHHKLSIPPSWPNFQSKFRTSLERIRKRTEQIKEKARTVAQTQLFQADLIKELSALGILPTGPDLTIFPCSNIPFPRNPNFIGRDTELAHIRENLDGSNVAVSFRSFALHGTGGIGKTQIALAYAYEQKDAGVDAVLWFDCETGLSLNRSFRDIASVLKLEGRSEDERSEMNRILVLNWLGQTLRTWLCIFDNIEEFDFVRNAWPKAGTGRVLATSRNRVVVSDPAANGVEIKVFDDEQASSMIMRQVGRDNYTESEKAAARELATRLGGLALAIVISSAQIRARMMSIADFVQFYDKYSERLNREKVGVETYYKFSLATCWQTAFERFSSNARRLMAVIAHLAPDALPEALFKPSDKTSLPEGMEFCADDWDLDEAIQELITASVVGRKQHGTNMLYCHRLTQQEFRNFIGKDQQHQAFADSSRFLRDAFPKLILGQSMRPEWPQCERYIQHVLILCRWWQESKFQPKFKDEFEPFLRLSTACAWYLMESNAWSEEMELMETAMPLCEDKTGEIYALLANARGAMEAERGHCEEAYKYTVPSLKIFQKIYGDDHPEVGNGWNNYANIVFQEQGENACERAIEYYTKTHRIIEQQDEGTQKRLGYLAHCNFMQVYRIMKDYVKAIYHAETCRKYVIAHLGEGSHFDGYVDLHLGNSLFEIGLCDEAEKRWKRALKIFTNENETSPVTNATKLKLNILQIQRGNYAEAITSLESVLVIAKVNEPSKGDKGEVARIQRRLAEAYEKKGMIEKATILKNEAEQWRKEIQGTRYEKLPDCDLSYAMMGWKGRW